MSWAACWGLGSRGRADDRGGSRVLRGGSVRFNADLCRSAYRYDLLPDCHYDVIGFRLLVRG